MEKVRANAYTHVGGVSRPDATAQQKSSPDFTTDFPLYTRLVVACPSRTAVRYAVADATAKQRENANLDGTRNFLMAATALRLFVYTPRNPRAR